VQESFGAVFALVGAAAATATVLEIADSYFASGMTPALPGPRGAGGVPLLAERLFTGVGEADTREDLGDFGVILRTVEAAVAGDSLQIRLGMRLVSPSSPTSRPSATVHGSIPRSATSHPKHTSTTAMPASRLPEPMAGRPPISVRSQHHLSVSF
jgi:hypothetical protein